MGNRILKLSFGVTFVLVMSCDELASVFGDQIEGDWEISAAVIYENFDCSGEGYDMLADFFEYADTVEAMIPPGMAIAWEADFEQDTVTDINSYSMSLGILYENPFGYFPVTAASEDTTMCDYYDGVVDNGWCMATMDSEVCSEWAYDGVWDDSSSTCLEPLVAVSGTWEITADELCLYATDGDTDFLGDLCFGYEVAGTSLVLTSQDSVYNQCIELTFGKVPDGE